MQAPRDKPPTFFDLAVQQRGCANPVLDIIAREVDFTEAEGRVAAIYSHGRRPAVRVGVLLRVMILQDLYGLSDPQAEVAAQEPPELSKIRPARHARSRARRVDHLAASASGSFSVDCTRNCWPCSTLNIEIGAGLGPMKGKIWRIGRMGATSTPENVKKVLGALKTCLKK